MLTHCEHSQGGCGVCPHRSVRRDRGGDAARSSGRPGDILGVVRDSTGAAIPGATVEVRNVGNGRRAVGRQQRAGPIQHPDLAIGTYEVQASLPGFQRVVQQRDHAPRRQRDVVDFTLPLGQVEETVTVTGESPIVDTTSRALSPRRSSRSRSPTCP